MSETKEEDWWRLDVVTLLAVIGEENIQKHVQLITTSPLCLLPRLIPAPQAFLRPSRPDSPPEIPAKVASIRSGLVLDTVQYPANAIHPVDDLPNFGFRVLRIRRRHERASQDTLGHDAVELREKQTRSDAAEKQETASQRDPQLQSRLGRDLSSAAIWAGDHVGGWSSIPTRTRFVSPLSILSIIGTLLSVCSTLFSLYLENLLGFCAILLLSLSASVAGYANWWHPDQKDGGGIPGLDSDDIVIRTREGAFLVVRCTGDVADELYLRGERCEYRVRSGRIYRLLMGLATILLMIAVVLLGNLRFELQMLFAGSYLLLSGLYWAVGRLPPKYFWDLSRYEVEDITPVDARLAHQDHGHTREELQSYTRTLWYTIRELKSTAWVVSSGAAPRTPQWEKWLQEALKQARAGNRTWQAVYRKDNIMVEDVMSEDAISSPSPPVGGVENPLVDVNDPQPVGTLSSLELDAYQSVSRPASQISNLLSTVGNQSQQDTWQACSYTMSFRRPIFEFMSSHCKQTIELVAGQKLSWWPLSDPEDSLAPGFTRVYSKQFSRGRFYDDIPSLLADYLFQDLARTRVDAPHARKGLLARETVLLEHTTLMHIMDRYKGFPEFSSRARQATEFANNDNIAAYQEGLVGRPSERRRLFHFNWPEADDESHQRYQYAASGILYLLSLVATCSGHRLAVRFASGCSGLATWNLMLAKRKHAKKNSRPGWNPNYAAQRGNHATPAQTIVGIGGGGGGNGGASSSSNSSSSNNNNSNTGQIRRGNKGHRKGAARISQVAATQQSTARQRQPVICLCADVGPNESIARTISLSKDDAGTFRELRKAFYSFGRRWWRWKHVTGIKFYRFDGFLRKEKQGRHYVDIHKDKERYPTEADPEYNEYQYDPQPWPTEVPYPGREAFWYFLHPEDCGTSSELQNKLPVRTNGALETQCRAFGVFVEQRYSAWAILLPTVLIILVTIGSTTWFIPAWLLDHPGDLQNATVPFTMTVTLMSTLVNILVSLFLFRITNS